MASSYFSPCFRRERREEDVELARRVIDTAAGAGCQNLLIDSHGQNEIGFAFSHLLGFQLLPRLKSIARQKLYRPDTGASEAYLRLQPVLTRPIRWDLIRQQYDRDDQVRDGIANRHCRR